MTTAAFASSIKGSLPELGYLTLQDKYLLMCSAVLFLCAIETPLVMLATIGYSNGVVYGRFDVEVSGASWCVDSFDRSCELDQIMLIVIATLWIGFNAFFIGSALRATRISHKYMSTAWLVESQQRAVAVRELTKSHLAQQESQKLRRQQSWKAATQAPNSRLSISRWRKAADEVRKLHASDRAADGKTAEGQQVGGKVVEGKAANGANSPSQQPVGAADQTLPSSSRSPQAQHRPPACIVQPVALPAPTSSVLQASVGIGAQNLHSRVHKEDAKTVGDMSCGGSDALPLTQLSDHQASTESPEA